MTGDAKYGLPRAAHSLPRIADRYPAPILMMAVFLLHVWRVEHLGQTAWKGGGFGMFSTVDSPAARVVQVTATSSDGLTLRLVIPEQLHRLLERLQAAPSESRMRHLARALAGFRWRAATVCELASAIDAIPRASHDVDSGGADLVWDGPGDAGAGRLVDTAPGVSTAVDTVLVQSSPRDDALRRPTVRIASLRIVVVRIGYDEETAEARSKAAAAQQFSVADLAR